MAADAGADPDDLSAEKQSRPESDTQFKRRIGLSRAQATKIVANARECIERAYMFERDNRREAEIDLAFVAGDQWPQAVKQARGNNRPMLTINQLPQFVAQVTNPIRQADIGIKTVGVDDNTDPQLARIFDELIRQIEYLSNSKQVYIYGHECQAKCGIGWWRVATKYVDDAGFDQEIRINKIANPLSVYCDPGAVEPDRSDARWIAVVEQWPRATFRAKWGDIPSMDSVDVPANSSPAGFLWASDDYVAVAELYKKKPVMRTLALLQDGETVDITDLDKSAIQQLQAPIQQTRQCQTFEVWKYLVSGKDVLEPPVKWAGKFIPLVPVIGAETPMKHGVFRYGVVRFARDPQQMLNFYRTSIAEAIAIAPKTPWLVADDMISNYLGEWNSVNQKNLPFLRYKPLKDFPQLRPQREPAPEVPQALIVGGDIASDDMKRATGIYDASMGARSNETSGIAIRSREMQGDTANSHYQDNLTNALIYTGRILVDLIPRIYDNQRIIRLTNPQGQEQAITINKVLYEMDGKPVLENDLSAGRFDVRVTVGKNFLTKRIEAVNSMLDFAKSLPPQLQILLTDLIVKNSDWPGAEELAKRIRNMLPPQALADPNDPNAPKPPQPQDDPMWRANMEKLLAQTDEIKRRTAKSGAEAIRTLAEADKIDLEAGHMILPQIAGQLTAIDQLSPPQPANDPEGFAPGSTTLQ